MTNIEMVWRIYKQRGDSAMHIAIRSRSKRIMEMLLRNPKDSRLLYKPNRDGETPYRLDQEHGKKSIIALVQGASTASIIIITQS